MSQTPISDVAGCGPPGDEQHIVLVGMMGSGKSAVGRVLASHLNRPLLDTDELVEQQNGQTVREIWESVGEGRFRELETKVLGAALGATSPSVIATGGGVVLAAANRAALTKSDAHVVWLLVDVAALSDRVGRGAHRPLLDDDPEVQLKTMSESRESLYQEVADAIVSAGSRSVQDVAKAVLRCCG